MSSPEPATTSLTGGALRKDEAALSVDIGIARVVPVFVIAFSLVYFYGVWTNNGLIRYYANVNEIHFSPQPPDLGVPMFWYGWLINGFVGGIVASAAALLVPRDWLERFWIRWAWGALSVSVGLVVVLFVLLREYFTR